MSSVERRRPIMRRARVFVGIPLLASLLLGGPSAATAQSNAVGPGLSGIPGITIPFFDFGFDCTAPRLDDIGTDHVLKTNASFVLLKEQTEFTSPTGSLMKSHDLSIMKCFFVYPLGTVHGAPYTEHNFRCIYDGKGHYHVFAHSVIFVRDTFAIEICKGNGEIQNT
jgi:hypothetical protein